MRKFNCLLLFFLMPFFLLAQQKLIGKVTDENGMPLSGASVAIAGKRNKATPCFVLKPLCQ